MIGAVVVGNPKAGSRTRDAAERLLARFDPSESHVIEVSELGPGLLGWGDPAVKEAVATVQSADLVVFASPTFKATYTGLLKLFLDQFAGKTGLAGTVALPLMLGAAQTHALAAEFTLKPVLAELGAICPTQSLYQIDTSYAEDGSLDAWYEQWQAAVRRLLPTA